MVLATTWNLLKNVNIVLAKRNPGKEGGGAEIDCTRSDINQPFTCFSGDFARFYTEYKKLTSFLDDKHRMDGQRKRQSKKKQLMLCKAMKKNKTKEMTDEITNIMTWFVSEVTNIIYPAIIQYEGRKIAERDRGDENINATNFIFSDRNRTPSRSLGCVRRRSRRITPLFSQQAPCQFPTRRHLARKPFFPSLRKIFPKEEEAMQGACSNPLTTCTVEPQTSQSPTSIYADAFFKETYDELISKTCPSQNPHTQNTAIPRSNSSCISTALVDSVLNKFSICQATNLQPSEDQGLSPDIDTLTAKIIHSSLSDLMQERASKVSVYTDMQSNNSVPAESLGGLIRRKITGYQQKKAKAPSSVPYNPPEPGEIDVKLLEDPTKSNTRGQSPISSTLGVCHRFLEDIISGLLSNILPSTASTSSSTENKMDLAELDLIHMKIISRVMAKILQDENTSSQHTEHQHSREEDMIQTVTDSVFNKLLTQFQSRLNMQSCLRNGCLVISEAIYDLVFQEVSGHSLQNSLSEKLLPQRCAEVDNIAENTVKNVTEPLDNPDTLSSHLSKLAPLIIEKLEANLMPAFSSLFPIGDFDTEKILLQHNATQKILHALQVLLSKHQMNMNKHISEREFLRTEDSQAMGDLSYLACTSTGDHSDSDIFVCGSLTNKTDILANRIAASIAKQVAKPEFQGSSEEEMLPASSSTTEDVRIVEKFPVDFGMIEKIPTPTLNSPTPLLPVTFVEEIVSRFLSKVLSSTDDRSPKSRRHLSRSKVNEIVENLKQAMEQGLSRHKISLVAATNEQHLPPEHEDAVNEVVLSISRNMLQKSGSEQDLYNDITGFNDFFPQDMATVIIEELSDCPFLQALSDSPATPSQTAMDPGRIADMVLSHVSVSAELKTSGSEGAIPGSTTNKAATETEELPLKIVPYATITHIPIAPDSMSDHLQVISLKTEPVETLQKPSTTQTEKCSEDDSSRSEVQRSEDSHFSLGSTGQPVVRPGELLLWFQSFSKTSFQKALKPVLNLMKAFQPKVDLPAKLAAHDTENEEGEKMVDENPERQSEGEKDLQSIKTIQTGSSLYVGSSFILSMDSEQLSEKVRESSSSLEAQREGEWFYDDVRQAWAIEDSFYMCEVETLAEGASLTEEIPPISEETGVDTAAAPKKGSSFFMKIPNALSRVHSFLSSCIPHRNRKVSPEITPTL
ncbi:PREDICTED: fibrous sheath-interacting protein 2-like [Crocodylus porosus]|uniref:fibrous sheath-interacting protein 2-like n=1 Tax=Crocodylus porosus TaxID=8502 RepID=UPI00093CCD23|nr:PREDICTED: fibrous sheath-interacting protein 2-like [Crocodylus porosus]